MSNKDSQYRDKTLKFLEISQNSQFWYFFASTGLNITKRLIMTLRTGQSPQLMETLIEHFGFIEKDFYSKYVEPAERPRPVSLSKDGIDSNVQKQLQNEVLLKHELVLFDLFNHLYFIVLKMFNESWIDME